MSDRSTSSSMELSVGMIILTSIRVVRGRAHRSIGRGERTNAFDEMFRVMMDDG